MTEVEVFERTYDFIPINNKQKGFVESTAKELLYSGAVGAGKSRAICEKGFFLNLKYPGNRGLIVRKEFTTLPASTLKTLLEEVIPPHMVVRHDRQQHFIVHKTGSFDKDGKDILSEIWYFGLDKKASQDYNTKILSTQWGWIAVDEITEISEADYDVLKTRLRYKIPYLSDEDNNLIHRQIFGATNPDGPMHWLYKKFFEETKPSREVMLATAYENARLPTAYLKQLEETLTGLTRDRLLLGKWVQAEGIIYKTFDPLKHVIDDETKLEEGGFLRLIDYKYFLVGGDSNFPLPRAHVIMGVYTVDGVKHVHVLDEFYKRDAHTEEAIAWMKTWRLKVRLNQFRGFHDPSDSQGISKMNGAGLSIAKANNEIIPGISSVDNYFSNNRIRIHKKCIGLIKELQGYKWKKDSEGETPDPDCSNHACDALRYALHSDKMGEKSGLLFIPGRRRK